MKVSLRTLLTAMCALCVVISVATLWPASAIMAIESLTTAREDQLLTSSYQTGQQVLTYFETASKAAKLMASMYNSSTLKNPEEPEVQFMQDYFNTLYFTFRDAPVLEFVIIVTLKDPAVVASMPQADQACDTDGIMMLPSFAAVFNNNTSGSMGCTDSLLSSCAPGAFQFLMTGGETVPSDPGQLFMKMFQADCSNVVGAGALWAEGLPGDLGQLDSGIRAPSWSDGVFAAGSGDSQFLLRKVFFNLIGPAWAPFGAVGGLSQRMSQATAVEGQVTVSLVDLLEEAASISTSKDKLMVISAHRKIVAVSDRSINVETFDEQGMLTLHYADNATAIGDYLADIATRILETYCDQSRCDWSNAKGLIRVAGSVVALEPLNDAFAEDLNLLLVSAVKESDILEPAHELNLNIAICACAVLVVLSGASFVMANYLSTPITNFSERLVAASLMQDLDTTGRPFVSEIDSMENALSALVAQLLEYKSFLPSSMFEADDDDTDGTEELQPSTEKSVTGSVAKKSAAFAPSMRSLASSRSRGKPAAVSTKCALKSKNIIILCTNLRRWSEFVYGEGLDETKVVTEQSTYITLITSTLCGKGTIDRFNGDRVVISFGSVNAVCNPFFLVNHSRQFCVTTPGFSCHQHTKAFGPVTQ
ncbi:hypothetical protein DIPPA_09153 [Diplonema papillatum]|nr:hypothetical protein DIPPA_09153 [Diplonema papillatum]